MKRLLLFFSVIGLLFGCEKEAVSPNDDNIPDLRPLTNQEETLIDASNNFAFDLIKEIHQDEPGNMFISPLSVGYALGMTLNGAEGSTKEGIKATLDYGNLTDKEINESYASLTEFLLNLDKKVMLNIANSIWYKQDYTVKTSFKDIVEQYYDAVISGLDFSDPNAKNVINDWIEEKTNDKIKDMLDQIPPDARMYLVNAIYFKAAWMYQFDKAKTEKDQFYLENGNDVAVDMMYTDGVKISYYGNQDFQFFDIPYGNKQYYMTVILPRTGKTVSEIINHMSADKLNEIDEQADTTTIKLYFPKFKLEYKKLLNNYLINMGMSEAFTPDARFPNLFEEDMDLMISRVLHQSFLEVNEEGSEAAAATIVEMVETSFPSKPSAIRVDRPFAFLIREKHSNTILFSGKLMNPSEL